MRTAITILLIAVLAGCSDQHDFVSDYDFDKALVEDLPWEISKTIVGSNDAFRYDEFVGQYHPDWNYVQYQLGWFRYGELVSKSNLTICLADNPASIIPQYSSIDSETCRLKDGQLWYDLYCSNGVVRVDHDGYAMLNLGVEPLEYRDFNQDGYMDVLVRRTLGGSACPSDQLILSRKQPSGQFYVVEHKLNDGRVSDLELDQQAAPIPIDPQDSVEEEVTSLDSFSHTVYPGETIAYIAQEYEVSENALRVANGIGEGEEVRDGQRLVVPLGEE